MLNAWYNPAMSFEPFQKFIRKAAANYGVTKEVEAAKVCQDFRSLVPEIFAKIPHAGDYIQPAYYKNYTLTLKVHSPAWAQEVIMRRPKIIEEINKKAGKAMIKNLRTQLGLF